MLYPKEQLSTSKKVAALGMIALFLVLTIVSAFNSEAKVTLMFGLEFAITLFIFADSFTHEFDYVPEDTKDASQVSKSDA